MLRATARATCRLPAARNGCIRLASAIALALLLAAPAPAAADPAAGLQDDPAQQGPAQQGPAQQGPAQRGAALAEVAPGAVLTLADGTRLRLAFLRLPDVMTDLPADRPAAAAEVEGWSAAAVEAIAEALAEAPVAFRPAADGADRYGALPALVETQDGALLQERLLRAGLARLELAALTDPRAAALLRAETVARVTGRGLWAAAPYRIRSAWDVADWLGTFQLVIARIHGAAKVGSNFFVNFGADYRSDFTVLFRGAAARSFAKSVGDPAALAGCPVLVRGWIEFWNGPLIAAADPAQVEFLEPCASHQTEEPA